MKKYVWSETRVEGGKPFTGSLPKPFTAIAGATGKTLRFAAVRAADAGVYTVKVTNGSGTTTSRAATLTVK